MISNYTLNDSQIVQTLNCLTSRKYEIKETLETKKCSKKGKIILGNELTETEELITLFQAGWAK